MSETPPPFPPQFGSRAEFGRAGIRWGTGEREALERVNSLTLQELQLMGVTIEMALKWADFYRGVVARNPANGSARGRIVLMEQAATLLRDDQ